MASSTIYRGDSDEWTLSVPLTIWSAGGTFFFGVKAKGDLTPVDATDASAVLKKDYDDSYISGTTDTDKVYTLTLLPTETRDATPGKYLAEFQWVSADGLKVKTFKQFTYTILPDINQRVS